MTMNANLAMNTSVLNLNKARSTPDAEIKRSASQDISTSDQYVSDREKFRDTLDSIKRAAADERAEMASQKAQKNRDAKFQAAQKAAAQKSQETAEAEFKRKAANSSNTNSELQRSVSSSQSKTGEAQSSRNLEDNQNKTDCDQTDNDQPDQSASETDKQQAAKTNVSSDPSLIAKLDKTNIIVANELEQQGADLSSELTLKPSAESSDTDTLETDLLLSDKKNAEQANQFTEKYGLEITSEEETSLSGEHSQQAKLKNSQLVETAEDISLISTQSQISTSDATQSLAIDLSTNQNPVAIAQGVLNGANLTGETSENTSTETPDTSLVALDALTMSKGFKSNNPIQLQAAEKGLVAQSGTNLISSGNSSDFKSIINEMKSESSSTSITLDSLLSEPKSSTDVNKPLSSSVANFGLQNFSSSEPSSRGFMVRTQVEVPVGQPQWSQAVGDKVLWLAAQNVTSAELHLHPEDLGPMQVKVSIGQDQTAQVSFTSHHAQVREILDQNIQRLKDMFAEQGMHSVQVDVSDRSSHRQAQEQPSKFSHNQTNESEEEVVAAVTSVQIKRLVDHYA